MNANSYNLEIIAERNQVEEVVSSIFHSILLHRSTGKFDYKGEKTFAVGTIGTEDIDCDFLDFTYVRINSKKLDSVVKKHIENFRSQLQDHSHNGIAMGTITLEFYQKRQGKWPFQEDCVPWEIWNLLITERTRFADNERNGSQETTASRLCDKILSVVEAIGKHEFIPKQPEVTNLSFVYDTTFSDVQPYLFRIYYNFGSTPSYLKNSSVGSAVRRLLHDTNI